MEDLEIVRLILDRRRKDCFGEIMRKYSGMVFSKTLGIVKSEELAKEISQQTFIKAYTHLSGWSGKGSLGPWLMTIATHLALNYLEKARRRRTQALERDFPDNPYSDEHEEKLQRMEVAINALPEQDRQIIRFHYYKGVKTDDIARQLNLSQSNVLVRLHRIREHLKSTIKAQNHDR